MELVYLWVESYKNIQKQGFNFSPRFRCEYDEEKNELEIIDKDETGEFYPKNFFGDNINITAVVGENGSGKSRLLNFLIKYFKIHTKMINHTNYLFVIEKDKVLYVISNFNIYTKFKCVQMQIQQYSYAENIDNEKVKKFLDEIYCSLYDYSLSFNMSDFFNTSIEKQYYPDKRLSVQNIESIDRRNMIYYLFENNHRDTFGNYFEPNEMLLESSSAINDKDTLKNIFNLRDNLKNITEHFLFIIYVYLTKEIKSLSLNGKNFPELERIANIEDFSIVLSEKISNLDSEGFDDLRMDGETSALIVNRIKNVLEYSKKIKESQIKFENILNSDINFPPKEFIINIENLKNSDFLDIFEKLPCFDINFRSSNGMKYNDLSNGEKTALRVRFYIEKIIRDNKTKNFIFLLDEPNNDLHPLWQRKLQNYLIKVFENRKQIFHFIITSHSPFILSDLPKENVIFLEKGKQVYPFDDGKQTFGANIHTLLSHGFFMKDGLMGEFAKDKIDLAIKYLNQRILTQEELDYCENIISIIGEPIIKRELQKMLDSKKLSEIEQIKKEIKALEERMTLIWKNSK